MQAETLLPGEKSPALHAAAMPGWCLKTALGQGPGNPRAPFDSALREPASPAPAGQIQTKHGHRCASPPPYPRPTRACLHHPSHRPNPTRIATRSTRCTEVCLTASSKLLVLGAPGIGKTAMVNMVARTLAAHPAAISDCNGREVGLDLVRDWLRSISQSSLFGRWQVKVVNELNRCSRDAQHPHEEVCPIAFAPFSRRGRIRQHSRVFCAHAPLEPPST